MSLQSPPYPSLGLCDKCTPPHFLAHQGTEVWGYHHAQEPSAAGFICVCGGEKSNPMWSKMGQASATLIS